MNLRDIVCKNLREMRLKAGLSQSQLASRIKKSVRYISSLENQSQNITLETLEALSEGLCVPVSELISSAPEALPSQLKQAKLDFDKAIILLNRYQTVMERQTNPPKRIR